MPISRVLIANRGEIAVRLAQACADAGLTSVAVAPEDDAACLHSQRADAVERLPGSGAAAYLDAGAIVEAAQRAGCDAVHPGYGFLSESDAFAQAVLDAGLNFIGPTPETLALFGDKSRARALAEGADVPILPGAPISNAEDARAFMAGLPDGSALMVKAVSGGGGRGMRQVPAGEDPGEAVERCASEARAAFGSDALYCEQALTAARHVEVQVLGDGSGAVCHFGERDCTLQRRHQKLLEFAPAPGLPEALRARLCDAALTLARETRYRGLGTIEFLVDASQPLADDTPFFFMEANARLQVEHTVTEIVTGVDLVQLQLAVAGGATLGDLGLADGAGAPVRGFAVQARLNMERMVADGNVLPAGGTLSAFQPATGPGLRTDTCGYAGYTTSPRYDSLLAKVIAAGANLEAALGRLDRALRDFRIEGVDSNRAFLRALVQDPAVQAYAVTTAFIGERTEALVATADAQGAPTAGAGGTGSNLAGVKVDSRDPLAVLRHGKGETEAAVAGVPQGPVAAAPVSVPEGQLGIPAPMQGTIVSLSVSPGDPVAAGQLVAVMEAMKMEHEITATASGHVLSVTVQPGDAVFEGHPLVLLEPGDVSGELAADAGEVDPEHIRPDLQEVIDRHAYGLDANRPDAVARRRKTGHRTARENLADLVDEGSFIEYAPLVVAAQKRRREIQDLMERTPADGMLAGIGTVNADTFGPGHAARVAVATYDYTVLAGTQGGFNHMKKDRLFEVAERQRLPVVLFAEGGGGRPGDTDGIGVAGLDCLAFLYFGRLSGRVPLVGITTGRCFAGNAALLGTCDVIIATEGSNIGMGGPAMIEGGGLGVYRPEEVGPMDHQVPNGVVDIPVKDEAEAVAVTRQYLSYFQGPLPEWSCPDQRLLRHAIPENRLRAYQVRDVIDGLADDDSVLELRAAYGIGIVTALARIEGRPVGILANNPHHLGGAIDGPAADKAVRFMQLCDAFDIPLVFLCDTPGFMVGPEVEKSGMVRQAGRLFTASASLDVPFVTIVLRKGYGLGAQAMAGGSFRAPLFTISWPTGEFGGMGLEGAVKLGYRKELEAETDPEQRVALYQKMVDRMYERGKAVNMAMHFEIDEVIDPKDTRHWIMAALHGAPPRSDGGWAARSGKKRPCIT